MLLCEKSAPVYQYILTLTSTTDPVAQISCIIEALQTLEIFTPQWLQDRVCVEHVNALLQNIVYTNTTNDKLESMYTTVMHLLNTGFK
jgi:hypothetical protein